MEGDVCVPFISLFFCVCGYQVYSLVCVCLFVDASHKLGEPMTQAYGFAGRGPSTEAVLNKVISPLHYNFTTAGHDTNVTTKRHGALLMVYMCALCVYMSMFVCAFLLNVCVY